MSKPLAPKAFEKFFNYLRNTPNVERAARLCGHTSKSFRNYRDTDPEFKAAWDAAIEEGLDHTEAIAHQRAFYGTNKPLTYQGRITYQQDFTVIDPETGQYLSPQDAPLKRDENGDLIPVTLPEVSDTLAMFLLKAHRPEKFRERQEVNLTGTIDIAQAILAARKRSNTN